MDGRTDKRTNDMQSHNRAMCNIARQLSLRHMQCIESRAEHGYNWQEVGEPLQCPASQKTPTVPAFPRDCSDARGIVTRKLSYRKDDRTMHPIYMGALTNFESP